MIVGNKVTLIGKNSKGKNRIREHGNTGRIVSIQENVHFNSKLNWALIKFPDTYWVWVNIENDTDFTMEINNEQAICSCNYG